MIDVIAGQPTDEEIAAIAAALAHCLPERGERSERNRTAGAWGLAGRYPELEMQELRAAIRVF